jgi:hypothetical protein
MEKRNDMNVLARFFKTYRPFKKAYKLLMGFHFFKLKYLGNHCS